jgi:hypothetical protein
MGNWWDPIGKAAGDAWSGATKAVGGAADWAAKEGGKAVSNAQSELGKIGNAISSAIVGKPSEPQAQPAPKPSHGEGAGVSTGAATSTPGFDPIGAIGNWATVEVPKALGGAYDWLTVSMPRETGKVVEEASHNIIGTPLPPRTPEGYKLGETKEGKILIDVDKNKWITTQEYDAAMKRYYATIPTEEQIGRAYEQQHPKDAFNPMRSGIGNVLEMNFGNIFNMNQKSYYEGLAQFQPYEKNPWATFYSPAAITGYTALASWGVGAFVFRPLVAKSGAVLQGLSRATHPILAYPIAHKGAFLLPKGANVAQAAVGGIFGGAMVVGAAQSHHAIMSEKSVRTEQRVTPEGELYSVERGGPAAMATEAGKQGLYWWEGIRGSMGKPPLPQPVWNAMGSPFYRLAGMKELPMTQSAINAAKEGSVINVTKRPGETLMQAKERLFAKAGLKDFGGLNLVSKDGRLVVSAGSRLPKQMISQGMWVSPAESPQIYFLKSSGYNISLVPISSVYKPRLNMLITQGTKVYWAQAQLAKGETTGVWAKTPRGFSINYPARAEGTL